MRETQVSDVADLSVPELAACALLAESLIEHGELPDEMTEKLVDRRKVFLDELVGRGAIESYSFV